MQFSIQRALSIFLGILMFMFGFLKFFNPINTWFEVQIQQSHLPHIAILGGKICEMVTGVLFLLAQVPLRERRLHFRLLVVALFSLFIEMLVAVYVHLQPGVPPGVLPLGVKLPVIPLVVLLIGIATVLMALRHKQSASWE
jgi:uncharacterized membrane protein HdeD (DUF308 family)